MSTPAKPEPCLFKIPSSRNTTDNILPEHHRQRVICGKTIAAWDHAVVYVKNRHDPYGPPTHLYFSFVGYGPCLTTEVCAFVDQWTYYRGVCHYSYKPGDHEYHRARNMAIQVVETYRRRYMKKHGQAPNPLGLQGTLNPDLARKQTRLINRKVWPLDHEQTEFDLDRD